MSAGRLLRGVLFDWVQRRAIMTDVEEIWQFLDPAAEDCSLLQLSLVEGFSANRHGLRSLILGINAGAWIHHQLLQHLATPPLCTLFYGLALLLEYPIIPVFVFATRSNGNEMDETLLCGFKRLVNAFGFYVHTAPADIEAELAMLCCCNVVDAVVTDNAAAFAFGARYVIHARDLVSADCHDRIKVYASAAIELNEECSLNQGGFFLLALLVGGGTNMHGLNGCGNQLALKLASRRKLGSDLLGAGVNLFPQELETYLGTWRARLHRSVTRLGYLAVAAEIGDTFPPIEAVIALSNPVSSLTYGPPMTTACLPRPPNLARLGQLLEEYFDWATPAGIIAKLDVHVWKGTCIRRLLKLLLPHHDVKNADEEISTIVHITDYQSAALNINHPAYQVTIRTEPLCQVALSRVKGTRTGTDLMDIDELQQADKQVWISAAIVELALPELVSDFHRHARVPRLPTHTLLTALTPIFDLLTIADKVDCCSEVEDDIAL
ncbi:hypothetical protein M378DRAFT_639247 [Amanita muscaria Koide BX008]|uniref:XPG-I domain-containing protein n=1 Tax=Amanita muscaria (strain Koide BX008) TaxID=946122 RepID=A0A0C2X4I3_AMAMK|nr:hypothetical protein M378DRAFT_639247 [Amanita muscaria Koide BX008]